MAGAEGCEGLCYVAMPPDCEQVDDLQILYEDSDLLALSKPAGMLVIPGRDRSEPSLRDRVGAYLARTGETPFVVHRIDRGTSGVVLFARNDAAHRRLSMSFENREVDKEYLAIVEGDPPAQGVLDMPLHTARRGRMRPALPGEEGLDAVTEWAALERFGRYAFLRLRPMTGRHHQIRVQLKAAGHPLAFDPVYGRKSPLTAEFLRPGMGNDDWTVLARTPLHAARITLDHPWGKGRLSVKAPLPADMDRALRLLRGAETVTSGGHGEYSRG